MKRKDHSGRSSDNQLAKELSRAKQSTFASLKKYSNLLNKTKINELGFDSFTRIIRNKCI